MKKRKLVAKTAYYFGDVRKQAELLSNTIDRINAGTQAKHIVAGGAPGVAVLGLIDKSAAIYAMHKRVARFYGLTSKYDGKGNLRRRNEHQNHVRMLASSGIANTEGGAHFAC